MVDAISYLIEQYWLFILAALVIGVITGWVSCSADKE